MPGFSVDTSEREAAERLMEFVQRELSEMTLEGRMVFAVLIHRHLKTEVEELKKHKGEP